VPHRHVPRWLQQACSLTHKGSLAMVLFWIWQWCTLDVSSCIHLDGAGVKRRPLATVVAENHRDRLASCNLIWINETCGCSRKKKKRQHRDIDPLDYSED
jgi:hypothetical protein